MINSVIHDPQTVLPKVVKTSPLQHVPTSKKKKYIVKIYEAQASSYDQSKVRNIRVGIISLSSNYNLKRRKDFYQQSA